MKYILIITFFISTNAYSHNVERNQMCVVSQKALAKLKRSIENYDDAKSLRIAQSLLSKCQENTPKECAIRALEGRDYEILVDGHVVARTEGFSATIEKIFTMKESNQCSNSGYCEQFYSAGGAYNYGIRFPVPYLGSQNTSGKLYTSKYERRHALRRAKEIGLCH